MRNPAFTKRTRTLPVAGAGAAVKIERGIMVRSKDTPFTR